MPARNRIIILTLVLAAASAAFLFLRRQPIVAGMNLASMDQAQTFEPIVLMPWINYGADFGGVPAWHESGVSADERIDQWLGTLEQSGVKTVVWFLFGDGRGSLLFDKAGYVTGVAPGFWNDYDKALGLLAKHKLQVIWVLLDYEIGMPAETSKGVRIFGHADLIEDQSKRASFIDRALRPVLRRGKGTSQIAGWILINEPEHLLRSGYLSEGAMTSFIEDAAAEIREQRATQSIGIADANIPGMIEFSGEDALDFLVFHHYAASLPPRAEFLRDYLQLPRAKPIYIGEFDIAHPPGGDLVNFIRAARDLGYAGVWPWSLMNRIDDSGKAAADAAPQFDAIAQYTRSVLTPGASAGAATPQSVTEIDKRLVELDGQPESHRAEAATNQAWVERCKKQITDAGPGSHPDLQRQLATATERTQMHSYLARESEVEIRWLHALRVELEGH